MKRTGYTVVRVAMGVVIVASLACEGSEGPTGTRRDRRGRWHRWSYCCIRYADHHRPR
jgi:hypothetical protein